MSSRPDDLIVLGLSLSSSWGNGHATTYRALLRGLASMGQRVLFLERDVPWYAANRDLPAPDFCELGLYDSVDDLRERFGRRIASAEAIIVGSYVPDGVAVLDMVLGCATGVTGFYDIDTPITLAALDQGAGGGEAGSRGEARRKRGSRRGRRQRGRPRDHGGIGHARYSLLNRVDGPPRPTRIGRGGPTVSSSRRR